MPYQERAFTSSGIFNKIVSMLVAARKKPGDIFH